MVLRRSKLFVEEDSDKLCKLRRSGLFSFGPVEQVSFVVVDLKFSQEPDVFVLESVFLMMQFLVQYVLANAIHLAAGIGKGAKALLPVKVSAYHPFLLMKFDVPALMSLTRSERAIDGWMATRMCI